MAKRSHGHSSNDKVVYDSLGNRRFRLCVTAALGERLKGWAKAEGVSVTKVVASAIYCWVTRGCPNPAQSRDYPKILLHEGRKVLFRDPAPKIYAVTIWLHADVHGAAIEAITKHRADIPGKMGAALFPTVWLSRIVAAFIDDNWKGFTDNGKAPGRTAKPAQSGPQDPQRPLAGGGGGVLPPPA